MSLLSKLFSGPQPKTVEMLPAGESFSVAPGKTILEAALEADIDFPHGCTVGTCSSCKCKLLDGKIRELRDFGFTLTEEELAEGYILACQSQPKSEYTRLEIVEPDTGVALETQHVPGVVRARTNLTGDIVQVAVKLEAPVNFVAGQFARITAPGVARDRCYSFAAAPAPGGQDQLYFFIRKIEGGAFTEKLFAGELDDQAIEVTAPEGYFYLRPGSSPIICAAGGSGLAPVLCILEAAVEQMVERDCVFVFGVRTRSDIYCLDRIRAVQRRWRGNFEFITMLSEGSDEATPEGVKNGLVTDGLAAVLEGSELAPSTFEAYMAGPPAMIDSAMEVLIGRGLARNNIHYDRFTDESDLAFHDLALQNSGRKVGSGV